MLDPAAFSLDELHDEKTSAEVFRFYSRSALGPAWRWRKAQINAAQRRVPERIGYDTKFRQLVDHYDGLSVGTQKKRCGDGFLDIAAAEVVFRDPVTRMQVEARLLAGLLPEEVAARSDLNAKIVTDYCDIFFDVLDCRNAKDWLAIHIFERADKHANELHSLVCRESYQGGPAVCEHWLARVPHLGEECDLTTARGREIKRLQLMVKQHQLQRTHSARLSALAMRIGDLSPVQPLRFVSLSDVIGRRTAQQLSNILACEEDASQFVQTQNDSHFWRGDQKYSA